MAGTGNTNPLFHWDSDKEGERERGKREEGKSIFRPGEVMHWGRKRKQGKEVYVWLLFRHEGKWGESWRMRGNIRKGGFGVLIFGRWSFFSDKGKWGEWMLVEGKCFILCLKVRGEKKEDMRKKCGERCYLKGIWRKLRGSEGKYTGWSFVYLFLFLGLVFESNVM